MKPPSPIHQALGVNPFPNRFINRAVPWGGFFRALTEERANENREMTVVLSYVKQQAASAFMRFKRIRKENGSICKSARERVDSRNWWRWRLHLMGSCLPFVWTSRPAGSASAQMHRISAAKLRAVSGKMDPALQGWTLWSCTVLSIRQNWRVIFLWIGQSGQPILTNVALLGGGWRV